MKAIKINVSDQSISLIDIIGDMNSMYQALECDTYTAIRISETEILWVDDNGLMHEPDKIKGAFTIGDYPQPLSGHGLIIGVTPDGENTDTLLSVPEIYANVRFVPKETLPKPFFQVLTGKDAEDYFNNPKNFNP